MAVWSRLMSAISAGINTYREKSTIPRIEWGWDTYEARVSRYRLYQAYFDSTVYSSIETISAQLKISNRLYRNVRSIYNPVARQNRMIVSNVYQGSIDTEHLTGGALPVVLGNDALLEPLIQIIKWSNLNQQLALYVRLAALLGDVFLWGVDDPQRRRVRLEVLHPSKVYDIRVDAVGNVKEAVIQYERPTDPALIAQNGILHPLNQFPATYVYRLEVDGDEFRTFKDGEPFDYGNGTPVWNNPYGFVPLVLASYDHLDLKYGINSFYNVIGKINEVNDQASIVDDSIRQVMKPILVGEGMSAGDLDASVSNRDDMSIIYAPKPGTKLTPLVVPLDIGAATANIAALLKELTNDMPELKLQQIQESGGNLSGVAIANMYSDAINSIDNARKNLDAPLMSALLMAVTMAGVSGYDGFAGFNADSFDAGAMDAYIDDRAVISDRIDKTEKLTILGTIKDEPEAIQRLKLEEIGYSDQKIDEIVASLKAETDTANSNQQTGDIAAAEDTLTRLGINDLLPAEETAANGEQQPSNPVGAN